MQIMQFTQCVDIVGEVKYNQLPADFAVGIIVNRVTKEVRMQRRKIKIPAHKVAAAQNMKFALSTCSAD